MWLLAQTSVPLPQTYGEAFLILALAAVTGYAVRSVEARIKNADGCCTECRKEQRDDIKMMGDIVVLARELRDLVTNQARRS